MSKPATTSISGLRAFRRFGCRRFFGGNPAQHAVDVFGGVVAAVFLGQQDSLINGNGIRHIFWDSGLGFEKPTARFTGWLVVALTGLLTLAVWVAAYASMGKF